MKPPGESKEGGREGLKAKESICWYSTAHEEPSVRSLDCKQVDTPRRKDNQRRSIDNDAFATVGFYDRVLLAAVAVAVARVSSKCHLRLQQSLTSGCSPTIPSIPPFPSSPLHPQPATLKTRFPSIRISCVLSKFFYLLRTRGLRSSRSFIINFQTLSATFLVTYFLNVP